MKKQKLFSGLTDYNNMLEKVLENKNFSAETKSILLSMIYKLEISYRDYKKTKVKVKTRDEFLNDIIKTIQNCCDYITTVKPGSEDAKVLEENNIEDLVNLKERAILAYPTETAFFSAISDISPKYFYIDKTFGIKDLFQKMLVNGKHESDIEILKNFNGWSWNNTSPKKENIIDNLIYHNLLYLAGNQFIEQWEKEKKITNFIDKLKNGLKNIYGEKLSKDIYIFIARVLIEYSSDDRKEEIKKAYHNKEKQLKRFENEALALELKEKSENLDLFQEKFFEKENKTINQENDKEKTKNEILKKEDNNEKTKNEKIIEENNDEVNNQIYKQKLFEKIKTLKEECLIYSAALEDKAEKDLENLQIYFLKAYVQKIKKIKTREALIAIIYEIRYYRNLYLSPKKTINQNEKLKSQIDILNKILITKACKMGVITIFSNDINANFDIINYAIDSKIIELEEIKIEINTKEEKGKTIIKVYDKETFEKQTELELNLSDIMIKKNKLVKLFL